MKSLSDLSMSKRSVVLRSLLVFLVACVAFTGCGSGPKLYPVKGKVLLQDGSELKAGTVTFIPDAGRGNKVAKGPVGSIGKDGAYTVSTDGKEGAPLGFYKVTVTTQMPGMDAGPVDPSKPPTLPNMGGGDVNKAFSAADTTPLSVEVVAAPEPGHYDLKVKR
jgi:hypothetical protein